MIVPAIPRYLNEEDVACLRHSDVHYIDSGLGGSFRVRFVGHRDDRFVFENISGGWERHGPYHYPFDEVRRQVYNLVAENPAFRDENC
jgi:hypothetical protein